MDSESRHHRNPSTDDREYGEQSVPIEPSTRIQLALGRAMTATEYGKLPATSLATSPPASRLLCLAVPSFAVPCLLPPSHSPVPPILGSPTDLNSRTLPSLSPCPLSPCPLALPVAANRLRSWGMEVVSDLFTSHRLDAIAGPTAGLTAPPLSEAARATGESNTALIMSLIKHSECCSSKSLARSVGTLRPLFLNATPHAGSPSPPRLQSSLATSSAFPPSPSPLASARRLLYPSVYT